VRLRLESSRTATGRATLPDWASAWPSPGLRARRVVRRRARRGVPGQRQAARIGRFTSLIDDLQTPYVFPQENGTRIDVRWARLTSAAGGGLRIDGSPPFGLAARRWTAAELDAATHTVDLRPGELSS